MVHMKSRFIVFLFSAIVLYSCSDRYEDVYSHIAVDKETVNVSRQAGELPFYVYYSGDWTAGIEGDVSWAELEKTSGRGISALRLHYEENADLKRSLWIRLTGGGESVRFQVVQKGPLSSAEIRFQKESETLSGTSGSVALLSNLSAACLPFVCYAEYKGNAAGWLQNITIAPAENEDRDDGLNLYMVTFDMTPMASDEAQREAVLTVVYTDDATGKEYKHQMTICQNAQ